tara:strand:- start:188 stop:754 length:567 start_codon:yes stop_codon:yes gene_type:complete
MPYLATSKGKKIIAKRKKNVEKLATKLDKHRGKDTETKWVDLIHHIKKKIHKVKVNAGMSKPTSGIVLAMEDKKRKAALKKRRKKLKKREKQRKLRKHHERSSQQLALERGKRARRLLNADTQMRARMLEREKPWCHRKHFCNRFGLILTTSISMMSALIALLMSTIIINFNFPYQEMHACGMDRNVW